MGWLYYLKAHFLSKTLVASNYGELKAHMALNRHMCMALSGAAVSGSTRLKRAPFQMHQEPEYHHHCCTTSCKEK